MTKKIYYVITLFTFLLALTSCSSTRTKYVKSPLDDLIVKYMNQRDFSILLADMNYDEATDKYYHKYRIMLPVKANINWSKEDLEKEDEGKAEFIFEDTKMLEVSPLIFEEHINDLGMVLLSKENGVLNKETTPSGYDGYVGNEKYGHWQTNSSGGSFWAFYGRYRFLSDLLYMPSRGYYRDDWGRYRRDYYRKKPYYGTATNKYGTKTFKGKGSNWTSKPTSFKSKVRNKVSRSASALKSRGYSSSKSYSKTKRNSSRYSRSSSRSRSGGFGK